MNNYVKEFNHTIDILKSIECVNLSIGASNKLDYSWICKNYDKFLMESIESYNNILKEYLNSFNKKLFIAILDQRDMPLSMFERKKGYWYGSDNIRGFVRTFEDICLDEYSRLAIAEIDGIEYSNISYIEKGLLIANDTKFDLPRMSDITTDGVFDALYSNGYTLIKFKNLYSEGNAIVCYSKHSDTLSQICSIAENHDFKCIKK